MSSTIINCAKNTRSCRNVVWPIYSSPSCNCTAVTEIATQRYISMISSKGLKYSLQSAPTFACSTSHIQIRRFATRTVVLSNSEATVALSPKVEKLMEEIVMLNMLEVKELTSGLKKKLGVNDTAMMMPMMGASISASAPAAPTAPPTEAPKEEKTSFNLKLESFDAAKKIALIKEIRGQTGLGLKEAKALVESAPTIVKEGISKGDAEKIMEVLKAAGASCVLE